MSNFLDGLPGNMFSDSRQDAVLGSLFGQDVYEISKALASSSSIGTDGSKLIGYDLDRLIRYATLDEVNNTPKIRRMHTEQANALTSEWGVLGSRGNLEGNFRSEGSLGHTESSRVTRTTITQKFLGRVGAVTRALQEAAGGAFGDAKAFELKEQLTAFLLNLERDIWHSDNSLNNLAFDGLFAQMNAGSEFTTDTAVTSSGKITAGGTLPLSTIRGLVHLPIEYGGSFTALYCAPQERVQFGEDQDGYSRWYKQDQLSNHGVGVKVDKIANEFGMDLDIIWDQTLAGVRGKYKHVPSDPSDATKFHSAAPAQPPAMGSSSAQAGGYLPDDTYYYGIAFVNEAGEGPIRLNASGQATSSTNNTARSVVNLPSGSAFTDIMSIRLYRSTTNGTDYTKMRLVKEVAVSGVAGGAQNIDDDGSIVPGSREAVLVDERSVCMIALEKPVAADLPRIDNTHRFSIDAMATTALKVPEHMHRLKNIGGSVTDPA